MKRVSLLILVFILAGLLTACGDRPAATTQPALPTTRVESATLTPTPVTPPTATPPAEQPAAQVPTPTPEPVQPTQTAVPTETPPPAAPPAASNPSSGGCINKAAFFDDITVPDGTAFQQGEEFVKTWRIRNEGTCTWGAGYQIIFAGGSILDGPLTAELPAAAPNQQVDVSVKLRAPAQGGVYTSLWQFQSQDGTRFGVGAAGNDTIWAKISVSWYAPGQKAGDPAPAPVAVTGCPAAPRDDFEASVIALLNAQRGEKGLPALKANSMLTTAARVHSTDMACNKFEDHTGSDGSSWYQRITKQGYSYAYASENIYYAPPEYGGTPQEVVNWWMNSTVHRNNILNSRITDVGVGYVFDADSPYQGYFTADFAQPPFTP